MGFLLRSALATSGLTAADVARRTGIAPGNLSTALRDANARPPTVRRILAALGVRLEVTVQPGAEPSGGRPHRQP